LRSSEVVSGIGDRAGIANIGVDEAWKEARRMQWLPSHSNSE
jgi:hypothetical protein